jgi:hypothetical protein
MKKIISFCIVILLMGCSSPSLYNELYKGKHYQAKTLRNRLKESQWLSHFSYDENKDTIFTLATTDITGDVTFMAWNKKDTVSYFRNYISSTESTSFLQDVPCFTPYMVQLVSKWDTVSIRNEEKIRNKDTHRGQKIIANRIVFNNKKYKITTIKFRNFFDPKRDTNMVQEAWKKSKSKFEKRK